MENENPSSPVTGGAPPEDNTMFFQKTGGAPLSTNGEASPRKAIPRRPVAGVDLEGIHHEMQVTGDSEICRPVTILAVDLNTGATEPMPSIDSIFLPALKSFIMGLAQVSESINQHRGTFRPLIPGDLPGTISQRRGPKGRKVVVVRTDEEYSGSIIVGDEFDTAMNASLALGLKYNGVSQALKNAAGLPAKVAGITFQYADLAVDFSESQS